MKSYVNPATVVHVPRLVRYVIVEARITRSPALARSLNYYTRLSESDPNASAETQNALNDAMSELRKQAQEEAAAMARLAALLARCRAGDLAACVEYAILLY